MSHVIRGAGNISQRFDHHLWFGMVKQLWSENVLNQSLHLSVSDGEQGSSVLLQHCFFVQHRLSPCSNLGYLVVIRSAHCYPYWCCCWVGIFSRPHCHLYINL